MALTTRTDVQVIFSKRQKYGNLTTIHTTSREPAAGVIARLKKLYFPGSFSRRAIFATYMITTSQKLIVSITDTESVRSVLRPIA
jgi:hypothetical protein